MVIVIGLFLCLRKASKYQREVALHQIIRMPGRVMVVSVAALTLTGCPDLDLGGGSSGASTACPVAGGPVEVGDEGPAGGRVFFVDDDNEHDFDFLEAAAQDITVSRSDGENALHEWAVSFVDRDLDVPETSPEVGSGARNTQLIIEALNDPPPGGESQENKAAQLAAEHQPRGCDWFLPSIYELELMFLNLEQMGLGDFSRADQYWSSTQADHQNAQALSFQDGSTAALIKAGRNRVRAARAGNF